MIPDNIALFVNETDQRRREAIQKALTEPDDIEGNLERLGQQWRIRVWFKEVQHLNLNRRKTKDTKEFTFAGFFKNKGELCYATRRSEYGTLSGFFVDMGFLPNVLRYDLVEHRRDSEFKDLTQFAKRFDQRFITLSAINDLWKRHSSQHGGKYKPTDFHQIGPKGRRVVKKFLERYAGIGATSANIWYSKNEYDGKVSHHLEVWENADTQTGRDIKISHCIGVPYVCYSSEYAGCGNGRYGLLVTERTFLWLEDD